MTYAETCAFLFSLEQRGIRLGLDRILGALGEHGDPHESFDSILIAGTNGKGSVAAIVASCWSASGKRTGLYTSPHLVDFRERIRIDGRAISPDEVVAGIDRIRATIDRWELSFFEATTLLAILWFRESGVEAASVEVGLGGRLDATRPVRARVTAVTSIGLDHVKILGDTRAAIAGEKAGIFRAGVPAAVGVYSADAAQVLRSCAEALGAPIFERRRALRVSGIEATPAGSRFHIGPRPAYPAPFRERTLEVALPGKHQVANAALAILAMDLLPGSLRPGADAVERGLERARWPGRFDSIQDRPRVLCDVAHNREGAKALAKTLRARGESGLRLVVGMVEGKDHEGLLRELAPYVGFVHYCTPRTERAVDGSVLEEIGRRLGLQGTLHTTPAAALDVALRETREEATILVTGSFYTVGEVMEHLGSSPVGPLWEPEPAIEGGRVGS